MLPPILRIQILIGMRSFLFVAALLVSNLASAQNSDLIIRSADTIDIMVNLDGQEYKMDGATVLKVTDIPEGALVNVTIMLKAATPKVYFNRHEFKGSFEWDYRVVVPEKKNVLVLEEIASTAKTDDSKASELGSNFVSYRFNRFSTPTERFKGTMDAASSLSMERVKEEKPMTTTIEDGVTVEEKSSRKQTIKKQGSSTVIHQERKTTQDGDERETSILKPRKEACEEAWDKKTKSAQMDKLAAENEEPGKLYMAKVIAIDNCIEAKDAVEILAIFDTEATRIEMAKFIYPSIVDQENFEILVDSFKSTSSWEAVSLYVGIKYSR